MEHLLHMRSAEQREVVGTGLSAAHRFDAEVLLCLEIDGVNEWPVSLKFVRKETKTKRAKWKFTRRLHYIFVRPIDMSCQMAPSLVDSTYCPSHRHSYKVQSFPLS